MKELIYVDIVEENAVVSLDTIIEFSGNSEAAVKKVLKKHIERLVKNGLRYPYDLSEDLNYSEIKFDEKSATLFMAFLPNSEKVLDFKEALVKDFFKAKEILMSSKAIFDAEQLEHIKQFMPDMSQYGKLVEKTGLAKVKLVKGYYRTDKHNKLSRLVGERIRLEHRLGGLFDEEIQIQIDALNEVIAKVGSEIEVERLANKALTNIK